MSSKKTFLFPNGVSETLFIPLYARAREQQQNPPLLIDLHAQRLVKTIDYDFEKFESAPISMTGVVIRASYFDAIVRQFIAQHSQPVVVHLGYGLDTRCQRLGAQAAKAKFYHIDMPEVMTLRAALLPPAENEHLIATCMLNTTWMDVLLNKHPEATFLFIIEGVLMYLSYDENKRLFSALASRFSGAEIHFDVLSTWLSSRTYLHDSVSLTHAKFQFGTDCDRVFERWHPRLRYQASFDLMAFDGWQRLGWPLLLGQTFFPALRSSARVVAYYIN